MKRLVMDVDETISRTKEGRYSEADVIERTRDKMRQYRDMGFEIVLFTSRNMRSFEGNVGRIAARTLPVLVEWLDRHEIPYDEIHIGKPWCGHEGFYVDDKAVRPDEFHAMSYDEIRALLDAANRRAKGETACS